MQTGVVNAVRSATRGAACSLCSGNVLFTSANALFAAGCSLSFRGRLFLFIGSCLLVEGFAIDRLNTSKGSLVK